MADQLAYDLDDVGLQLGSVTAVTGVDLRVRAGESVALVGPSGAGKTSLLRLMAGMLAPTHGHVRLFDHEPRRLAPRRLASFVGLMSQQLDLVPPLTVKHNVQAGALGRWGRLRSTAALLLPLELAEAREACVRVGIDHRFGQRISRCSGGEQQRAALARLLVQDPRVLLVDEPVSAVDPGRSERLLALLRRLADEDGRTLVASLHAPKLARRHFDRIVGLRDGAVVFDLDADAVEPATLASLYHLGDHDDVHS